MWKNKSKMKKKRKNNAKSSLAKLDKCLNLYSTRTHQRVFCTYATGHAFQLAEP